MFGRYLGIAGGLMVLSVVATGFVSQSPSMNGGTFSATSKTKEKVDDGGWSDRAKGGWSSESSASSSSGEVRLGRNADSHFYADVDVGGANVRMMVDSGASMVALTRADAEAIGINVDSLPIGGMAKTAGGDVPLRRVVLDSVQIDGIEVRQVEAAVVDADMGVSLLGQSYLSKLDSVKVEGDTMTLR